MHVARHSRFVRLTLSPTASAPRFVQRSDSAITSKSTVTTSPCACTVPKPQRGNPACVVCPSTSAPVVVVKLTSVRHVPLTAMLAPVCRQPVPKKQLEGHAFEVGKQHTCSSAASGSLGDASAMVKRRPPSLSTRAANGHKPRTMPVNLHPGPGDSRRRKRLRGREGRRTSPRERPALARIVTLLRSSMLI